MNKKQVDKIMAKVPELLKKYGFVKLPDGKWHQYYKTVPKIGKIELSIRCDKGHGYGRRKGSWAISVYAVWDDPKAAIAAGKHCSKFSGKDNYLFIKNVDGMVYVLSQYN